MRLERLLGITICLLNRDIATAKYFAQKYEVSTRTILRDIEALEMAGIPIVSTKGKNGGFSILKSFKIEKNFFSREDIKSIFSAISGLKDSIPITDFDEIMEKIKNMLPYEEREDLGKNRDIVIDYKPWFDNRILKDELATIKNAIKNNQKIKIDYRNPKTLKISIRTVEPLTLFLKGNSWYLYAFCIKRVDYRVFKIMRVEKIKLVDEFFDKSSHNLNDNPWDKNFDDGPYMQVKLKFHKSCKEHILSFFKEENLIELNDYYIYNSSMPDKPWVVGYLLSFGTYLEVLEPLLLKEKLKETITKMYNFYKIK